MDRFSIKSGGGRRREAVKPSLDGARLPETRRGNKKRQEAWQRAEKTISKLAMFLRGEQMATFPGPSSPPEKKKIKKNKINKFFIRL